MGGDLPGRAVSGLPHLYVTALHPGVRTPEIERLVFVLEAIVSRGGPPVARVPRRGPGDDLEQVDVLCGGRQARALIDIWAVEPSPRHRSRVRAGGRPTLANVIRRGLYWHSEAS